MVESAVPSRGWIYISYRPHDTAYSYSAGWLYDRLADRDGGREVLRGVYSVPHGEDFAETVAEAVGSSNALLVLIGAVDNWAVIVAAVRSSPQSRQIPVLFGGGRRLFEVLPSRAGRPAGDPSDDESVMARLPHAQQSAHVLSSAGLSAPRSAAPRALRVECRRRRRPVRRNRRARAQPDPLWSR